MFQPLLAFLGQAGQNEYVCLFGPITHYLSLLLFHFPFYKICICIELIYLYFLFGSFPSLWVSSFALTNFFSFWLSHSTCVLLLNGFFCDYPICFFYLYLHFCVIHVTHLKNECNVAGRRGSNNNGRILNQVKLMGVFVK